MDRARLNFAQDLEQLLVVRLVQKLVPVDIDDLALFIDNEKITIGKSAILSPGAVHLAHLALWMKIREQVIRNASERVCPRDVAGNTIYRNTQDLGISVGEA